MPLIQPSYWLLVTIAICLVELMIAWGFDQALIADREKRNAVDGCRPDSCMGTFLNIVAMGFLLVAWPILAAIAAVISRFAFRAFRR